MYLLTEADAYQFPGPEVPYVLDLVPMSTGLAVISTDQQLCVFDPARLNAGPRRALQTVHENITAVKALDASNSILATTGKNGTVAIWDLRNSSPQPSMVQSTGQTEAAISSLACENRTQSVAVGTEYANHQASIILLDIRSGGRIVTRYDEVHSDDVTELKYHPENAHILLSGSTDGLVNICDTRISDEDEVVIQAFNHGSIHHAGFLTNTDIFALSHDEKLAVYDLTEEQDKGSAMADFGDVRSPLDCQYVSNVSPKIQGGAILGAGSQDRQIFQLVHLSKNSSWEFDRESLVSLPGAHGSEIVRTFYVLDAEQVVYTGGEDGQIKAWRPSS